MLSYLDCIVFPDRCEVIEVIPSQRYIYPIYKNGSSSLHVQARQNKWKIKINEQIKKINQIEIILRNPEERLISGINTFVQHILREHPGLDQATILWFAKNYLYLDRHYCPQFFWIVNIARYLSPTATIKFLNMNNIVTITDLHEKPVGIVPAHPDIPNQVKELKNSEMYQRIDQVIFNHCIGQVLTFKQIIQLIQQQDPIAYEWTIGRSQRILNPTYALS